MKIYTGEPVSEPGKILLFNSPDIYGNGGRSPSGGLGIYFMDGETGHVSGPVLESQTQGLGRFADYGACDVDRIVLAYADNPSSTQKTDLWQVYYDGTGLTKLADAVGIIREPDINVRGEIVMTDDTRWDFAFDELAFFSSRWGFTHASGPAVDTNFIGLRPSWSPDGNRVALGATRAMVNGESAFRVSLYRVNSTSGEAGRVVRETSSPPEFPFLLENEEVFFEGGNSLAWDPQGEYLAYDVLVSDTVTGEGRSSLVLWKIGTSDIRVLVEGVIAGKIRWSPDGEFLLYHRQGDGWYDPGIWQIPREGGTSVNLSAITMEAAYDRLGGFCK